MSRMFLLGCLVFAGALAGCGPKVTTPAEDEAVYSNAAMEQVGEVYTAYAMDKKKPMTGPSQLGPYEIAMDNAVRHIRDGSIVVLWTAPIVEGSEKILAYEKGAPESGGAVLLQDARTIRKMTAEEFKAAPKAAELPAPAAKK